MVINELENALVQQLLRDAELAPIKSDLDSGAVTVTERRSTGVGFFTDFERSPEVKLFSDGVSLRWGKVGARLNADKLETGYVVYVDDGYLTTIEGYTYGEDWPDKISEMELYELVPGMELPKR